ncbi:hypothetical protein M8J75_016330 [Diaphorina citri]|nr:hypothetical protein M8J75_016330 [Diaphorina citri]
MNEQWKSDNELGPASQPPLGLHCATSLTLAGTMLSHSLKILLLSMRLLLVMSQIAPQRVPSCP